MLLDVVSIIDVHKSTLTLTWKKKKKTWTDPTENNHFDIYTFYLTHMGIMHWCSQVFYIGEGESNQEKPTRYCDQKRRSVFDLANCELARTGGI